MVRVLLAGVLIAASSALALAGSTHKVTIDTEPEGATVYFNDREAKPVCQTPCTVDAPIGQTTVIIELDGYGTVLDQIDVPKRASSKPFPFKFAMAKEDAAGGSPSSGGASNSTSKPSSGNASSGASGAGTIVIEASSAKGALVKIDESDKGKVPVRIEVDRGSHHVTVIKDGVKVFDKDVKVEAGEEVQVTPRSGNAPPPPTPKETPKETKDTKETKAPKELASTDPPEGEGDGSGSGGGSDDTDKPSVTKTGPEEPHDRFLVLAGVLDVGFRQFTYSGGMPTYEQDDGVQALAGPAVELWPGELLHIAPLRGFSLYGRVEFPLNHQLVQMDGPTASTTSTNWGSYEASARYRHSAGDSVAIELSAGFIDDKMTYNSNDETQLAKVPIVEYKAVRAGIKALVPLGAVEPYVLFELRPVLNADAGTDSLSKRYSGASVTGYRFAGGAAIRASMFVVRFDVGVDSYGWSFTAGQAVGGATDRVIVISTLAGVAL